MINHAPTTFHSPFQKMENTQSFQFFNRGPSPAVRLVFFSVLSLLLLFVDARYRYLESTRSALSVLVSPMQRLATLPGVALSTFTVKSSDGTGTEPSSGLCGVAFRANVQVWVSFLPVFAVMFTGLEGA